MNNLMKNRSLNSLVSATVVFLAAAASVSAADQPSKPADASTPLARLLLDFGWRFAFGQATDVAKNFGTNKSFK